MSGPSSLLPLHDIIWKKFNIHIITGWCFLVAIKKGSINLWLRSIFNFINSCATSSFNNHFALSVSLWGLQWLSSSPCGKFHICFWISKCLPFNWIYSICFFITLFNHFTFAETSLTYKLGRMYLLPRYQSLSSPNTCTFAMTSVFWLETYSCCCTAIVLSYLASSVW